MIYGLTTFAWVHTILSLVGLVSGLIVLIGLFGSKQLGGWTALYLASTVATSVTGFGFPFDRFQIPTGSAFYRCVVLAAAILARYVYRFAGAWRWIYALGVVLSLYFLVFVAVAQLFKKVPALAAMAPTLSEPPFASTQLVVTVIFVVLAIAAAIKFPPSAGDPALRGTIRAKQFSLGSSEPRLNCSRKLVAGTGL